MRTLSAWAPVVLWAALILSAANDRFSDAQTGGWLERLFGRVPPEVNVILRKGAHVAEYAVLALLAWRARRTIPTPLLIAFAVACTDETLQTLSVARTGTAVDIVWDMTGAILALTLWPGSRRRLLQKYAA